MATLKVLGMGPGDPGLVTVKSAEELGKARIVIAPKSKSKAGSTAGQIARRYIGEGTELVEMDFPMVDPKAGGEGLSAAWRENARRVEGFLREGDVAFAVLGDPTLYGTILYLLNYLKPLPWVKVEIVPGVSSYSAMAADLAVPLALGDESFCVCPMTMPEDKLRNALESFENVAVLKVSAGPERLKRIIEELGLARNTMVGVRIGLKGERFAPGVGLLDSPMPYFSIAFIKKGVDFFDDGENA